MSPLVLQINLFGMAGSVSSVLLRPFMIAKLADANLVLKAWFTTLFVRLVSRIDVDFQIVNLIIIKKYLKD